MDVDGTRHLPLTSSGSATWPGWYRWFPDSRRLAIIGKRGETRGLWQMDIATRREELIRDLSDTRVAGEDARLTGQLAEFQLAPSLTRAAFSVITPPLGRRVVFTTGVDAFAPRPLTGDPRPMGYPAWSPDERSVAVEIKDGSSTHAGAVDVATGALRQLSSEPGQTWVRSWSADGRRLVVAALRSGLWSLQWIDATTGETGVLLPPAPPHVYVRYPDASPRGDLVAYSAASCAATFGCSSCPDGCYPPPLRGSLWSADEHSSAWLVARALPRTHSRSTASRRSLPPPRRSPAAPRPTSRRTSSTGARSSGVHAGPHADQLQ